MFNNRLRIFAAILAVLSIKTAAFTGCISQPVPEPEAGNIAHLPAISDMPAMEPVQGLPSIVIEEPSQETVPAETAQETPLNTDITIEEALEIASTKSDAALASLEERTLAECEASGCPNPLSSQERTVNHFVTGLGRIWQTFDLENIESYEPHVITQTMTEIINSSYTDAWEYFINNPHAETAITHTDNIQEYFLFQQQMDANAKYEMRDLIHGKCNGPNPEACANEVALGFWTDIGIRRQTEEAPWEQHRDAAWNSAIESYLTNGC